MKKIFLAFLLIIPVYLLLAILDSAFFLPLRNMFTPLGFVLFSLVVFSEVLVATL